MAKFELGRNNDYLSQKFINPPSCHGRLVQNESTESWDWQVHSVGGGIWD